MIGALVLAFVIVVAIPVSVLVSGAIGSAVIGEALRRDRNAAHEGSELLEIDPP